jgi:hypothetical protein
VDQTTFTKNDLSNQYIYELRNEVFCVFDEGNRQFFSYKLPHTVIANENDYHDDLTSAHDNAQDIIRVYQRLNFITIGLCMFERSDNILVKTDHAENVVVREDDTTNIVFDAKSDAVIEAIKHISNNHCAEMAQVHNADGDLSIVSMYMKHDTAEMSFCTFGDNDDITNLAIKLIERHIANQANGPFAKVMIMNEVIRNLLLIKKEFEKELLEQKSDSNEG